MKKKATIALAGTGAAGVLAVGVWLSQPSVGPTSRTVILLPGTPVSSSVTLPGGTPLVVTVKSPGNGAVLNPGSVNVEGSVQLGDVDAGIPDAGAPSATVVYAIDVSRSSNSMAFADCGDQNKDGIKGTLLDCEISALIAANQQAIARGVVGEVGVVTFGASGAAADMGPDPGQQLLTAPSQSDGGSTSPDVDDVLRAVDNAKGGTSVFTPIKVGSASTCFGGAVKAAAEVLKASKLSRKYVILVSEGKNGTLAPSVSDALKEIPAGTVFYTFALGKDVRCNDPSPNGSLLDIAAATGGSCVDVPEASGLQAAMANVIPSRTQRLSSLSLTLDGGGVPISSVVPTLATTPGPARFTFVTTASAVSIGSHHLCIQAQAEDSGGSGSATACVNFQAADPGSAAGGAPGSGGNTGAAGKTSTGGAAGAGGVTGSTGFHVCQCKPAKCIDCTASVNVCQTTPGCPEIIQCVLNTPTCNLPHECSATCEAGRPSTAISLARTLATCFGGC